jgi:chaperone required for assembly of F1-ATPase
VTKHKTKIVPVYEVAEHEGAFALHRDGRFLMTPAGKPYIVPTQKLARALVQEWRAQGEKVIPTSMPLTQLAATAFDVVGKDRSKIIRGLVAYVGSDLLCHFAEEPEALTEKQRQLWQPVLDWCAARYGVRFVTGCGVMPLSQQPETAPTLAAVLEVMDDLHLSGLSSATDSSGSLLLGLALAEGFKNADEVFTASVLDTLHQAIRWGSDPVTEARHASILKDLSACEKWFALLAD